MIRYVDLDSTLAYYDKWNGPTLIGEPVESMISKVKHWLHNGDKVVIFTTRLITKEIGKLSESELSATKKAIEYWCLKYIGQKLPVTATKGFFDKFYDDKGEHIIKNTGLTREEEMLQLIYRLSKQNMNDSEILNSVIKELLTIVDEQK
jgi:hypothetical protein